MTQAVDLLNFSESDAVEEYLALMRALRRKTGFGLFFVHASPAKERIVLADLRRDLPQKRIVELGLNRTDERLFDQLEAIWIQEKVDIFWIRGLDQALLGYEDVQRLMGWNAQDLTTYSWKDVPPILSHLNLGRERFEAKFDCAVVFVVPLFVVKYLLRRAGDFFDWKSGFFEFPENRQALAERMIEDANYNEYLKLDAPKRMERILQIKDLLDAPEIENDRRAELTREMGRLFESGQAYEQAIISYERAVQLKPTFSSAWNDKGDALRKQGRYEQAVAAYQSAIKLNPKDAAAYYNLGVTYSDQKDYQKASLAYQRASELYPEDTVNHSIRDSIGVTICGGIIPGAINFDIANPDQNVNASNRLSSLQEELKCCYENLEQLETASVLAYGEDEKVRIRQKIRLLKTEISSVERDYWLRLKNEFKELAIQESEANTIVEKISAEISANINDLAKTKKASNYINTEQTSVVLDDVVNAEMLEILQRIQTELAKPSDSASGKLKVAIPLIPSLISYEAELDLGLIRRLFPTFYKLTRNLGK